MILVKKLCKNYGKTSVLKDIDLHVQAGEFVSVMGPSGAGKTTLLNVLSTIDMPSQGDVIIEGKSIYDLSKKELAKFRRERLGFIFQDYNLLDTLTVKENILLPLALANVSKQEMEQRLLKIVKTLHLEEIVQQYPYEISGGQKQRTASARAIITNPALVFADEPTGSLDSRSATTLLEGLNQLNETFDTTILMITHDAYAASFSKRVLFVKDGQLLTEIYRGDQSQNEFFTKVLDTQSVIIGGRHDVI